MLGPVTTTLICLHIGIASGKTKLGLQYVFIVTFFTLSEFYPVHLSSHVFVSYSRSADYRICVRCTSIVFKANLYTQFGIHEGILLYIIQYFAIF